MAETEPQITRISAALPAPPTTEPDPMMTKQGWWLLHKIQQRLERKQTRGVPVTIAEVRKRVACTCVHTAKHHRKSGGCRKGCDCQAGIR